MPDRAIIGQYWPEDSLVHAMDPRVKFILSFVLMAAVFCAATPLSLAVAALFIVGFYAASRIPLLQAIRAIGPLLVLVVLTALLNVLFVQGGHVYFEFGIICISEKGLQSAVFIGCRLLLLLMGMSLLTLTTATLDITAAFERLMAPLSRIGVPAHELGMILGIALRFLPQFMTELGIIYCAIYIVIARFGTQYLVLLFMNADEAQSVLDYTQRISYAYAYGTPLLLGVNVFRLSIQGMGYSRLSLISGLLEMIARTAVGIWGVPQFGFAAACLASPLAWALADCFLIPAYYGCLNARRRQAARVRRELPTE